MRKFIHQPRGKNESLHCGVNGLSWKLFFLLVPRPVRACICVCVYVCVYNLVSVGER